MWLRAVLGAVYTAMAAGQAASWTSMPGILGAYRLGGPGTMRLLAAVLIAGELACGLWSTARPRSTAPAPVWIYGGVTLVWAALSVQAIARGLGVANCGCFGVYLSQRLSWFVLAQDALLLVYAALMALRPRLRRPSRTANYDDTQELITS